MLWFLFFEEKAQQYFVSSSCVMLDKKTLLKIWLNPRLNLTIFRGTGPRSKVRGHEVALLSLERERFVFIPKALGDLF